jgi:hypothetical protein
MAAEYEEEPIQRGHPSSFNLEPLSWIIPFNPVLATAPKPTAISTGLSSVTGGLLGKKGDEPIRLELGKAGDLGLCHNSWTIEWWMCCDPEVPPPPPVDKKNPIPPIPQEEVEADIRRGLAKADPRAILLGMFSWGGEWRRGGRFSTPFLRLAGY